MKPEKTTRALIEEKEAQIAALQEADKLLAEWQALTTEKQKERRDALLCHIVILEPRDQKLVLNKLAEGEIVARRDAKQFLEKIKPDCEEKEPAEIIYTSFIKLPDGSLAEMLHDPLRCPSTFFAVYKDEQVTYQNEIKLPDKTIAPYPANNLLGNGVIQLASVVEEYVEETALVQEIKEFIHRYLDIGEFEDIATYYVLFTWVYDRFTTLPYLRALGQEAGIGKSRFLQAIGILCYKPMFCGGATTTSPIFRIIELYRGTLIIDETDFKISQDFADIIKILNCGFMKGFPVLRTEKVGNKFEPSSYDVYCPKILASKREYQDKNLESRFLVKEMESTDRDDIPINLPPGFWQEATHIRNKLLMWRFRKYYQIKEDPANIDKSMEHRLNQITIPLLSIIGDDSLKKQIRDVVQNYRNEIITARGMGLEGDILRALQFLWGKSSEPIPIGDISDKVNDKLGEKDKLTSRKVGSIIRGSLRLRITGKIKGNYCIDRSEANRKRFSRLIKRYGLNEPELGGVEDIGTSGDFR